MNSHACCSGQSPGRSHFTSLSRSLIRALLWFPYYMLQNFLEVRSRGHVCVLAIFRLGARGKVFAKLVGEPRKGGRDVC
jgi:hypothetical protein